MPNIIKFLDDSNAKVEEVTELAVLPLRNTVIYPFSVQPLVIGISRSVLLIEDALKAERTVGLVVSKDPSVETPSSGEVHEIGTVAKIVGVVQADSQSMQVILQGIERFKVDFWITDTPYLKAHISLIPDRVDTGLELDALIRSLKDVAKEVVKLSPNMSEDVGDFLDRVSDARTLAYMVATNLGMDLNTAQKFLEIDDINTKLHVLINHLSKEKEILSLGKKIRADAREEMGKAQREYFLRQQLKAIKKELGETESQDSEVSDYRERIKDARLPEEAEKEALRELNRMEGMSPQSAEYGVIKTYLDWLLDLPWNSMSQDHLDIDHARAVLDEDHYGLQEIKDRIIEYLAVRKLLKDRGIHADPGREPEFSKAKGAILCFSGPPGVGKTSLGQSIARALGRKFTRMSMGGMRDEAEIRGHRRTYVGAMPGRIIQAMKRAGTRNPVFILDEVDKIGSDWRGDPSSALLEVLDPAQNHTFRDNYLDVDFDLSEVIFIATANQLETIPLPLLDRLEVIQLDGYTEHEKIMIAQRYLIPRQLKANGLMENEVIFTQEALQKIIQDYTQESGVRNLERQIGAICRKSVVKITGGKSTHYEVTPEAVRMFLKKEKFASELSESIEVPGIATGLAVTRVGGDILFIEATRIKGKGTLTLTGQLGEVMRESARIAYSYVQSQSPILGIDPDVFEQTNVHIHVPAGAIPKDGPSAGVAMTLAIASVFTGRPVRSKVGMTGEVTLRGRLCRWAGSR